MEPNKVCPADNRCVDGVWYIVYSVDSIFLEESHNATSRRLPATQYEHPRIITGASDIVFTLPSKIQRLLAVIMA